MRSLIAHLKSIGVLHDKKIEEALLKIPREEFVPQEYKSEAYCDYPLPLLEGQTISQPSTVVIMIQALELNKTDKVLEIGTGSGWNAALIAQIVKKGLVYTTEVRKELMNLASNNLKKFSLKNIQIIHCDGANGYLKEAPYDKIIVTAAAPKIMGPWKEQLNENGIIVAPVGEFYSQRMLKIVQDKSNA